MVALIIGIIFFMAGLLCVIFDEWRQKSLAILFMVAGTVYLVAFARSASMPNFNQASKPTRLATHDTLYIVPKNSDQGVALIAAQDLNGRPVIVVRDFVAQHVIVIKPTIK